MTPRHCVHAILRQNKILGVHRAGVDVPPAWSMHGMHPGGSHKPEGRVA